VMVTKARWVAVVVVVVVRLRALLAG
jgi:hypothetical protein